ncbi:MAG: hypothetical protein RQ739_16285 [Desulfotignum sp.]|nr:hypothetical protein [Desulfotignum sp.]
MQGKQYRLGDQIITGYDDFFYTWEMNMAMGEHRIGNCFVIGDILVFEPLTQQKEGCLQLEFYERLKKLPTWDITHYFCASANLRDAGTGRPLTHFFNNRQLRGNQTYTGLSQTGEHGIFRLGRNKVSIEKTGAVSWRRYKRPNCIKGGSGFIKSGILFLGPGEYDVHESMNKKRWHENLGVLPEWDKTFAWSHHNFLHCVAPQVNPKLSFWQVNLKKKGEKQSIQSPKQRHHAEPDERKTVFYDTGQQKKPWRRQRSIRWKQGFKRILPLLMGSFRMTCYIIFFILKKAVDLLGFLMNFFNKMIWKRGKRV